ncbi:uncharacterized protein J8A68_003354 [[Candida] subhashii]|uniref:J domain-containing protein n=1 Tax=[Candida] subhashii TaxID=561895 RepID=A0A8J5QMC6_9ASCO|nr:uncharacterized protein J8A68_003354 [[Candida] subhashii]KAG7663176.1 hypothetical protein J8A68_003354 [[Candida] subhashii]
MRLLQLTIRLLLSIQLVTVAATAAASSTNLHQIQQKIQQVDNLFSSEGPTANVLQEYERVVNDLVNIPQAKEYLPQLYFKKALIEINLHKEIGAIEDLKMVLKLDSTIKPAKTKLIEILMSKADFNSLVPFLDSIEDKPIFDTINNWNNSLSSATMLYQNHQYEKCLIQLNNEVINIAPKNYESGNLHYLSALELFKQNPKTELSYLDDGSLPLNKIIIKDLTKLINISPWGDLNLYEILSKFVLFTENQFENAKTLIKNCLRINNEFKPCGDLSKFYSKFQTFLSLLEQYSIITGHYYATLEGTGQLDEELINPNIDYKFVHEFLFKDELKVSKLEKRRLDSNIETNYDYLMYRASQFLISLMGNDKEIQHLIFVQDLQKLACESNIHTHADLKITTKTCELVDDSFFPKRIPEITKLLHEKKLNEAAVILERYNKYVKQTKLFQDLYSQVEEYLRQQQTQQQQHQFHQQQQQQQQYHQQRQRQQQQYQQQQQRQRQQKRTTPKNDYYKVLDVPRDADDRTIKKAYRAQTLKYHPDKYKNTDLTPEEIEKKMQDINQAYEVLGDPELRERYDRGDDPNDPMGQSRAGPNFNQGFPGGGGGDFFQQFFRQSGGGNGGQFKFNFNPGGGGGRSGGNPFGGNPFGGGRQRVRVKKNRKAGGGPGGSGRRY